MDVQRGTLREGVDFVMISNLVVANMTYVHFIHSSSYSSPCFTIYASFYMNETHG